MKKIFKLFTIACCLMPIACSAQFNFIGRKINLNQPKSIPFNHFKSGKGIPSLDFKFDSIRQLTELTTYGNSCPWLSPDGNRIYYSVGTSLSINPQFKIYMAEKKPGQYKFSNPHPLSFNSNDTNLNNTYAWLTQDELNIYFVQGNDSLNTSVLYHAKSDSFNHDFSTPVKVKLIGKRIHHILGPSLTRDSMNLYFLNWLDSVSIHLSSIYIFNKTAVNEYTLTDSLKIPDGYLPYPGTLTSDGLKYFFSLDEGMICRIYMYARDSLNEKFNKLYYINNPYINDSLYPWEGTPYLSVSDSIFLFVKALHNYWEYDSIYIAYGFNELDNIIEYIKKSGNINIFPNPVNNYLEIIPVEIYHSFDYYLTNLSGQLIKTGSFTGNTRLDVSLLTKGLYIFKLFDKNYNLTSYHKILKI